MTKYRALAVVLGTVLLAGCADASIDENEDQLESNLEGTETQGPGTDIPEEELAEGESEEPETEKARPAKAVLDYTWFGQSTSYWCGPGSTRIALGTRMDNPPSQTTLAKAMGTTTNGTNHIGLPAAQLNKYLKPPTKYVSRSISWTATASQQARLKKDLVARIGSGYPIVANVVSGWRPPGYPSGTIYHYVAVVGYDDNGNKALIADPAGNGAAGPRWRDVPKTYWIKTSDLGRWIGGKGYTG